MPNSTAATVWSRASAGDLTAGLMTPFSWSILSRSAERAMRSHYRALGYELPSDIPVWRRMAGRAYLNTSAVTAADQAVFAGAVPSSSLGQLLLGRGQDRHQGTVLRQELEQAPSMFDAIERWWERVQGMQWRQATVLQIMEEIEPKAEAVLTARDYLTTGLGAQRRQITQWVAQWLPTAPDTTLDQLFAGLDGHEGTARYRHDLALLVQAASQDPAAAVYVRDGRWPPSLPAGPFHQAYERFLAAYGRWAKEPLEAACPRWREAPAGLLAYVAAESLAPARGAVPDPDLARDKRIEATDQLLRRVGLLRRRQLEPALAQLQRLVDLLPASREALVTVMAVARAWALGVAQEAMVDGRLQIAQDVFLLELEELKQISTGEWNSPEQVLPIVESRRSQQAAWTQEAAPEIVAEGGSRNQVEPG